MTSFLLTFKSLYGLFGLPRGCVKLAVAAKPDMDAAAMNWPKLPWMVAIVAFLAGAVSATEPASKSAASRAQPKAVERRTATIHWDNVPLGDGIVRLEKALARQVFLDRRVDPSQGVSIDVTDASADEVLAKIAATTSLGVSELGPVKYLGPPSATNQLRTLAAVREQELAQLPFNKRGAWERKTELVWPHLTEPRILIENAIQARGWQVRSAELMPHDLWTAGGLPELSLTEQLTLLLIGFDLTFRLAPQDRVVEIVPLEGPVTLRRHYRLRNASAEEILLRQQLAEGEVHLQGNMASVDARVEDHERLMQLLQDRTTQPHADNQKQKLTNLYTLRVQDQPVGKVLRQLAQRLNWRVEIDEQAIRAAGLTLDRRISFAVENSSQEKLLDAVLQPAGLSYDRDGDRLRIIPQSGEKSQQD